MNDNWYAPLDKRAKKKGKKRALRLALAIGLPVVLAATALVLLFTVGNMSFDFRVDVNKVPEALPHVETAPETDGDADTDTDADAGNEAQLPGSKEEFFAGVYEPIDSESAKLYLERVPIPVDFEVKAKAQGDAKLGLNDLYNANANSIVGVDSFCETELSTKWGTGIVISSDGLILTNTHNIDGATSVMIKFLDGQQYEAKLVGADTISDLAVLKINATGLDAVEFGDSSVLLVGDEVAAIGNPLGADFMSSLSNGIISGIDRGVSFKGHTMSLLQTTAALNKGNSGGALFNMYGQVIGVTNMKMNSNATVVEGMGLSIPSNTVLRVVNSILEHGEYRGRSSIGLTIGEIPEAARLLYELPEGGLYIADVTEGTDAAEKGITVGDVILKLNGIEVNSLAEVAAIKNEHEVGDELDFTIWRNGEIFEVSLKLMDTVDVYG